MREDGEGVTRLVLRRVGEGHGTHDPLGWCGESPETEVMRCCSGSMLPPSRTFLGRQRSVFIPAKFHLSSPALLLSSLPGMLLALF